MHRARTASDTPPRALSPKSQKMLGGGGCRITQPGPPACSCVCSAGLAARGCQRVTLSRWHCDRRSFCCLQGQIAAVQRRASGFWYVIPCCLLWQAPTMRTTVTSRSTGGWDSMWARVHGAHPFGQLHPPNGPSQKGTGQQHWHQENSQEMSISSVSCSLN